MTLTEVFVLRDGIDVYYKKDEELAFFIFLASRKRIHVKCLPSLIKCLSDLDGVKTLGEVYSKYTSELQESQYLAFCGYLVSKNILIKSNWKNELQGNPVYNERMSKQLDFLLDIVSSPQKAIEIQDKIKQTKVAILGVGSVGGWIARELVMLGFQNFGLYDSDVVEASDISRHQYFKLSSIGDLKTKAIEEQILSIDSNAKTLSYTGYFSINTTLDFLDGYQLIINCLDEPYIGYTSIKLSRYCVSNRKFLLIGGGFDAHLGSFGELIIPGQTPCADCYANYFTNALKNWQPMKRTIENNDSQMGGFSTLSAFSASMSVLEILKFFIDPEWVSNGRGEFLLPNYHIDSFTVEKDPNCKICSTLSQNA